MLKPRANKKEGSLLTETLPLNQMNPSRSGALWPSKTHLAFLVKSIFLSQTKWPITLVHPLGALELSSRISKAAPTSYISFLRASIQKMLSLIQSRSFVSATSLGISIPYLWVFFLNLAFTAKRMAFLLLMV